MEINMGVVNTDLIVKLLNMTFSDNDNEALSAMRKANKILKDNGIYYNAIIGLNTHKPRQEHAQQKAQAADISDVSKMFSFLEGVRKSVSTLSFVGSLWNYYKRTGGLTEKQLASLIRFYREHGGR